MHTLKEKLDENKKSTKALGELLQLLCKTSCEGKDDFLTTWLFGWLRTVEINNCCHHYLATP
jgi:hypothetical protein